MSRIWWENSSSSEAERKRIETRIQFAAHFANMMLNKIKTLRNCETCYQDFFTVNENVENVATLKRNNYQYDKTAASVYFVRGFTRGANLVYRLLPRMAWKAEPRRSLTNFLLSRIDVDWVHCSEHRRDIARTFNECIVVHCITKWCIHINQILTEQKTIRSGNLIEKKALQHYQASYKKKRVMDKE